MELVEGAVVAERFRLNRMLGRGGMGSVWHATHLGLDIPCAVKFIEGEFAALPEAQQRFEREAKAAAQLRSPHVVQILDHGISEGRPYIAMELLDGEDLGKRLTRVGRLAPTETATVIMQVCRALTKAHSLGIVHRDLKPDNIFLVRDDDREIAKVLDFGIAKSNSTGLDGSSNTKTGAMLGTPYYMSPEQAQGIKAVDYRSDLWSLAVIAYQCVTGRLPFESEALGDLLVKIIVSELPIPSRAASVPQGFDEWWAKAAARQPDHRFQSAKEFGESLHAVFQNAGVSVSTPNLLAATPRQPEPSRPFGMTPPSAMAQSVVAGQGAAPALNANATTGAPIARTYSGMVDGAQGSKPKTSAGLVVGAALMGLLVIGGVAFVAVGRSTNKAAAVASTPETPKPPVEVKAPEPPKVEAKVESLPPASPVGSVESKTPADPKKDEKLDARAEGKGRRNKPAVVGAAPAPVAPAPAKPAKPQSDVEKMGF